MLAAAPFELFLVWQQEDRIVNKLARRRISESRPERCVVGGGRAGKADEATVSSKRSDEHYSRAACLAYGQVLECSAA